MKNLRKLAGFTALCLIWGTSWAAFSEMEGHCPPFRAAAIRYGVAAFLVLIAAAARRQTMPRGRPLRAMVILGITMVAAPFTLLLWGGRVVPVATSAVIFALAPIALTLIASAGSGEPAPRFTFYATLGGFSAMVLAMSGALSLSFAHIAGAARHGAGRRDGHGILCIRQAGTRSIKPTLLSGGPTRGRCGGFGHRERRCRAWAGVAMDHGIRCYRLVC